MKSPDSFPMFVCAGSLLLSVWNSVDAAPGGNLKFTARTREETVKGNGDWQVVEKPVSWDPKQTAIVICDMWNQHWCKGATQRVGEMAPRMNEVVRAARARGVFIIHCPSSTMGFYTNTPQRALAMAAPKAATRVALKGWCNLDPKHEALLPIDDSDGGCDDWPKCPSGNPWTRQIDTIQIEAGDAITDSDEAYNLMEQRGIKNVIVMGVHVNMCVLGRPFSIRQMSYQGKNVLLMRDLTDAMYNSRSAPFVSHFRGKDLVIEHIEKYWCPSVTSSDIIGGQPFQFAADKPPIVTFIIGENEYHTWETLPEFSHALLDFRGFQSRFVTAPSQGGNDFTNYAAIKDADLLVVSARRRAPQKAMMELIRQHVAAGKPVVGIRTASHAFDTKAPDTDHEPWPTWDADVLGGNYQNHYNNKASDGTATVLKLESGASAASHPILAGLPADGFVSHANLYRNSNPRSPVTVLVTGNFQGNATTEPVAWVNTTGNRRVFYTSLGAPEDFKNPPFRRLLLNGILWALNQPVPGAEMAQAK